MRALQITALNGPDALVVADVPEPAAGDGVLFAVHAAGVSFPDVLQARGLYQASADPPYVPGVEAAGVVLAAPAGGPFAPGDRVAALTQGGGWAEVAVAEPDNTFALPAALDFAEGAGLVLNYHTAWFALVMRGQLREGETVLVHGAAGGLGTATLQTARGLGARTIAVVSSDEKEQVARAAGADEVLRSDGPWRERGARADRRRRRPRRRPRRRRPVHGQPPRAAAVGTAPRARLHRRRHPRGPRQPAAAAQHRRSSGPGSAPGWQAIRTIGAPSASRCTDSQSRAPSVRSSARASPSRTAPTRCGSSRAAARRARSCSTS